MKQIQNLISHLHLKIVVSALFLIVGCAMATARVTNYEEVVSGLNLKDVSLPEVFLKNETGNFKFYYEYKGVYLEQNQDNKIQGKVINKETGEVIPYCNIVLGNTFTGTSSNEEGEFIISIDSLPAQLVFSHLNYEKKIVNVSKYSDLIIELEPFVNNLEAVIIQKKGKDRYAMNLAKEAFKKTSKLLYIQKYGQALYRQKSKNGEAYTEFSEIIFDINYNTGGIKDWDILEGRYAIKDVGIQNKNYTLFSRILKSLQPDTDDIIFPLRSDFEKYYDVRVIESIGSEGGEIVVLWFKPLKNVRTPIFEGEVSVNISTYEVLKVTGKISRDDLKLIGLTLKNTFMKNYELSYEMVFKKDSILDLVIDYIKVDQELDYFSNDNLQTHVSTTSNLTFFEYYNPTSHKKLGRQFRRSSSDWQKLNEIGYNEKFWEDNPIVKRTPIEKEVVASFEATNAFESIFLNSKEQIASRESDISDDSFIKKFEAVIGEYNHNNAVEKVYLHTDKDIFSSGEELYYSAYAVLGSNNYFSIESKVFHVDLISPDNKIVVSQAQAINEGRGKGSMKIFENLPSGVYQLRSYTNWMRNFDEAFFFTKTIEILNNGISTIPEIVNKDKIDLQFFPEGGDAILGLSGQIAFKAIGKDGLGKKIDGKIINSKGEHIVNVNTIDRGAGFFSLEPELGEVYSAVLSDNSIYPLPPVKNQGYTMSVNNMSPKSIRVKVQASKDLIDKTFYVIGHIQNKKYYQGKFEFKGNTSVTFEIPKYRLPSGVMTLTLFDANMKPWSERILFVNNKEELVITTKLNRSKFNNRDKIVLDIHVTDTEGRAISTDLSIAVTDANKVQKDINGSNILTHLLLQSDVKGQIENPAIFFRDENRSTISKLDLIMLTHGWRRFNWEEKELNLNPTKIFDFAKGYNISGIVQSTNNKPLANVLLNMIAQSKNKLDMYTTTTKLDGSFVINNISHLDSTKAVFNAYNNKKKTLNVKVTLDDRQSASSLLPFPNFNSSEKIKSTSQETEYLAISLLQKEADLKYDTDKIVRLNEVVVKGKVAEKNRSYLNGMNPDATVYMEEYRGNDFIEQLSRVAGIHVVGSGRLAKVSIRGSGSPLWIIDGVPIYDPELKRSAHGGSPTDVKDIPSPTMQPPAKIPEAISILNTDNIERIEVLRGGHAAMYGMRGNNGVILIYTKSGKYNIDPPSPEFIILGYSGAKEFYSPKYDVKLDKHIKPDYRTTLYWNSSVTTDKNGDVSLTFFNSDTAKQIQIAIEGLSIYGVPGAYLETFGNEN